MLINLAVDEFVKNHTYTKIEIFTGIKIPY